LLIFAVHFGETSETKIQREHRAHIIIIPNISCSNHVAQLTTFESAGDLSRSLNFKVRSKRMPQTRTKSGFFCFEQPWSVACAPPPLTFTHRCSSTASQHHQWILTPTHTRHQLQKQLRQLLGIVRLSHNAVARALAVLHPQATAIVAPHLVAGPLNQGGRLMRQLSVDFYFKL
jgi:hypothetical protein